MDGFDRETGEVVPLARGLPHMPPEVAKAIIAVKKKVRQLGSDDRNEHGKYNFVSVDKFYERIGRLMAEAGLALLIDESAAEVRASDKTGSPWLFVQYDLSFVHESGVMSPPLHRSCALPISGPQAYGAAQSYIEKQFMRQVFKVPTGERDADETAAAEGAPGRATAPEGGSGQRPPPQRQQAAPAPSELKLEARKRWQEMRNEIDACLTVADLEQILGMPAWAALDKMAHEADEQAVADDAMQLLRDRMDKRRDMLLGHNV